MGPLRANGPRNKRVSTLACVVRRLRILAQIMLGQNYDIASEPPCTRGPTRSCSKQKHRSIMIMRTPASDMVRSASGIRDALRTRSAHQCVTESAVARTRPNTGSSPSIRLRFVRRLPAIAAFYGPQPPPPFGQVWERSCACSVRRRRSACLSRTESLHAHAGCVRCVRSL